jgi:hypothetical protein
MTQLSDTQAVILSAACAREGGFLLPITAALKGGAVKMVLTSLIKKELAEEIPAEPGAPVWREDEDGNQLTLRATRTAYEALGLQADTTETANTSRKTREGTKQEALIAMLKRPEGAGIDEIAAEFGWAKHTVRGAIAGALKKKLGLEVTSEKVEGRGRVYNIA